MKKIYLVFFILSIFLSVRAHSQTTQKNRLIVLSDIEAEVDDTESFVRLLLYANEIDLKGLIATTSVWKRTSVAPGSIKKLIEAYREVLPNLLKHDIRYPGAESLLNLVKAGLPKFGMQGVGKGMDSEGSDWIIHQLEEDDNRPLWVSVWGGANTLAQALYKIEKTRSAAETKRLMAKLRVYTISDQDDSGIWIRNHFPNLFYIVSPGDDYGSSTWIGITHFVKGIDNEEISNSWLARNIQQGHGALGAAYPDVAYGMEGDTPSWLSLIPNGLNEPEHPEWGGWGGRYEWYKPDFAKLKKGSSGVPFEPETRPIWTDAIDNYSPFVFREFGRPIGKDTIKFADNQVTIWRWRTDFQNDFAARMDWCVKSYKDANHPPVVVLEGSDQLTVNAGQEFVLDAGSSTDPDGDNLSFLWFTYPEAGSYKGPVTTSADNAHGILVTAPDVDKKETIHFIVKVSDKGSPALSRYKRVIVTILPK